MFLSLSCDLKLDCRNNTKKEPSGKTVLSYLVLIPGYRCSTNLIVVSKTPKDELSRRIFVLGT